MKTQYKALKPIGPWMDLKKLTKEQVNIWWDSIAPENAPKNIEENNWKYKLAKNNKFISRNTILFSKR